MLQYANVTSVVHHCRVAFVKLYLQSHGQYLKKAIVLGIVQKLRAKHLSSLIVALAPPRIATQPSGSATASQAALADDDDDDLDEDIEPEHQRQQAQQQQAAGTAAPQHSSNSGQPQKFTGSNPHVLGRAPLAALPTAPVGQIPDAGVARRQATTTSQKAAAANSSTAGGQRTAGPAQGIVAEDGLNAGQRTAVHRWVILTSMCARPQVYKVSTFSMKQDASDSNCARGFS